ncbi:AroB-related putative sugar phosphate phospholyase (cyclizing) [Fluviispira sanaruensis]|uniref:3-dehydroquinate synthase n=1 Tax=Fluviispira sanaruensis TaxID=2493639 RepID=A0A4P2VWS4_FLUSA|nr:AroB-related putative sugar phosphate phospholyase (cyclizing) [Fluviispira sanaruensis]BBH54065.1 3-dehydroquinate synthase [Fluviispira sanaruensis]
MSKIDSININSHFGNYTVKFIHDPFQRMLELASDNHFFIIDENVFRLYEDKFYFIINNKQSYLLINPTEISKSLEKFPFYIEHCIRSNVKRETNIVAIGGGIVQDISAFLSSIIFRGLKWTFFPTTLLSQADSCIGSKTSINCMGIKNIVGNFYPPNCLYISALFLDTLSDLDLRSGLGEIIKIHAIYGQDEFKNLEVDFDSLFLSKELLLKYIQKSLIMKKKLIEIDEFDKDQRLVLNYGHSFGHAIESATNYAVPHGIAVSMGCHFANYISMKISLNNGFIYKNMQHILRKNIPVIANVCFNEEVFFDSLSKDKKNTKSSFIFILPGHDGIPVKTSVDNNSAFKNICREFLYQELRLKA